MYFLKRLAFQNVCWKTSHDVLHLKCTVSWNNTIFVFGKSHWSTRDLWHKASEWRIHIIVPYVKKPTICHRSCPSQQGEVLCYTRHWIWMFKLLKPKTKSVSVIIRFVIKTVIWISVDLLYNFNDNVCVFKCCILNWDGLNKTDLKPALFIFIFLQFFTHLLVDS